MKVQPWCQISTHVQGSGWTEAFYDGVDQLGIKTLEAIKIELTRGEAEDDIYYRVHAQ